MMPKRTTSSHRQDKSIAGLYDMERSLGSGHFAVVKLARHVFSGEKVAIKVIDKTKLDDVAKDHLYQEVRCMKLVQHPNVVRLYQVIDTQSKLYLILEYGDGGDMYDHIMKYEGQGISEEKARHYFKQIVSAIDYCHKLHVVHRDLKPENVIFFKNNDLAKLTDFGFSNSFLPGEKLYTSCGSLAYSAPEILLGDSYDAPAVDVWSLGVILYMMVCGKGPFNHASDSETLTKIMDCKYDLPDVLSGECKSLIKRMLVRKASERASIDSIIHDPWVSHGTSFPVSHTPLISEISISRDVHLAVIAKMSESWSKEDIEKSLKENHYDHATATYFLLAERLVKKRHGSTIPFHVKLDERHSVPSDLVLSSATDIAVSLEETNADIPDVSIESKNKSLPENLSDFAISNNLMKEQCHTDDSVTDNASAYATEFLPTSLPNRPSRLTYPFTKQKTKSSPNLLNEPITEENESEFEESPRNSPHLQRRASQRRRQFHSCRLSSPIHSRRSSYSSSDDDDGHILLEKSRLLSHSTISSVSNSQSTQNNVGNNTNNNTNNTSSTGNNTYQELNEKMLSLIIDDLEQTILSSKVYHPNVNLKLNNMMNSAYGRHLSDTNLTTYSLQLQLVLAKEKLKSMSISSPQYRSKKCSSDTNLVKRFSKKKQHLILPSEFFKTKEMIFKYLKRGSRTSSKSSSSLSLSAPIEEEDATVSSGDTALQTPKSPTYHDNNESQTFSDIHGVKTPDLQQNAQYQCLVKCDSHASVKYYRDISAISLVPSIEEVSDPREDKSTGKTKTAGPFHVDVLHQQGKQMFAPIAANGSVCCSLI